VAQVDVYAEGDQVAKLALSKEVSPKHLRTLAQLAERKDPNYLENVIKYQTREKGPRGWDNEFADRLLKALSSCQGDTEVFKKIMLNSVMLYPYFRMCELADFILGRKQQILQIAQQTYRPYNVKGVRITTKENQVFLVIEIPEFYGDKRRVSDEIKRRIPQLRDVKLWVEIVSG
jgi:hypothetical protein